MEPPLFPRFRTLGIDDRAFLHDRLWAFQPTTSELTFTNLFIWRKYYGFEWSILDGLLVVAAAPEHDPRGGSWALPPVGPGPRAEAALRLLRWLREERGVARPRLRRVDSGLASELRAMPGLRVDPARDDFDYVYLSRDLGELSGSRYHAKRNHIARFVEAHAFLYEPLGGEHLAGCLELAEAWCALKRCEDDLGLLGEFGAIKEALRHFADLGVEGAVIRVEGDIKAFTLGELLNDRTAVIHLEKADPGLQGLYPLINREFCRERWSGVPFINREQDMGHPGLRRAKQSYHPERLEEKYVVGPAGDGD